MLREWCPKCQSVQTLNRVVDTVTKAGKDNKKMISKIVNYNCAVCGIFVKSEVLEESEAE